MLCPPWALFFELSISLRSDSILSFAESILEPSSLFAESSFSSSPSILALICFELVLHLLDFREVRGEPTGDLSAILDAFRPEKNVRKPQGDLNPTEFGSLKPEPGVQDKGEKRQ